MQKLRERHFDFSLLTMLNYVINIWGDEVMMCTTWKIGVVKGRKLYEVV